MLGSESRQGAYGPVLLVTQSGMELYFSLNLFSRVPLRSPITRGARSARCGSSSLRRIIGGAGAYGMSLT